MDEVARLIKALGDKDAAVRRRASVALGDIGDSRAVPVLVGRLQDGDKQVREEASWALGVIGDVQAVPELVKALKDKERSVRRNASAALGKIGDAQAIPALIIALKDTSFLVSGNAAWALGEIADRNPTPVLRTALPRLRHMRKSAPTYQAILDKIEEITAGMKDLPLTAAAPGPVVPNLPVIADAPALSPQADIPISSTLVIEDTDPNHGTVHAPPGWGQRVQLFLRGSQKRPSNG